MQSILPLVGLAVAMCLAGYARVVADQVWEFTCEKLGVKRLRMKVPLLYAFEVVVLSMVFLAWLLPSLTYSLPNLYVWSGVMIIAWTRYVDRKARALDETLVSFALREFLRPDPFIKVTLTALLLLFTAWTAYKVGALVGFSVLWFVVSALIGVHVLLAMVHGIIANLGGMLREKAKELGLLLPIFGIAIAFLFFVDAVQAYFTEGFVFHRYKTAIIDSLFLEADPLFAAILATVLLFQTAISLQLHYEDASPAYDGRIFWGLVLRLYNVLPWAALLVSVHYLLHQ